MELLIPSGGELAGWAGVLAATLLFIGLGRLVTAGRAAPETALLAGWGGACLLLTVWGVATSASLLFPAALVVLLGLVGCLLPGLALRAPHWRGMGRILVVSLPLLAVMASARPSLPDTFLNLLPNAAYLWDHGVFPADDRVPSHSLLPGAPYNMQLAAFIVSEITRRLALNAMIGFNIVLQLALALLLARLVAGSEDDDRGGSCLERGGARAAARDRCSIPASSRAIIFPPTARPRSASPRLLPDGSPSTRWCGSAPAAAPRASSRCWR